jgi:hypothetical protein
MSEFDRQLSLEARETLAEMACDDRPNWWRDLLSLWAPSGHEGALRLAIRNGYMNFYSCGQSVARIEFDRKGTPKLYVHRKYVSGSPDGGQDYVKLLAGQGCDRQGEICAWGGASMLRSWIANSVKHRGPEKCDVEKAVAQMPTVIDLEMGLPASEGQKTPLRMDMVALERTGDGIQIVFWEAKMISDGRLRSRTTPKVFEQVEAYERFLADDRNRRCVVEAYRRTCKLLRNFNMVAQKIAHVPPIDDLIVEAARDEGRLDVAPTPRLLIFDDGAKRDEKAWQGHLLRLSERMPVTVVPPRSQVEFVA